MTTVSKGVSTNFGGIHGAAWTSPTNAQGQTTGDNVYASGAPGKSNSVGGGFGVAFSTSDIPNGSTINSVTVVVEWKLSALVTGGLLTCTAYHWNGVSSDSLGAVTKATTAEAQQSFVCSTPPTLAELRTAATDSGGGGSFFWIDCYGEKGSTNTALTCSVDFVSVTVDYTAPAATKAPPFERQRRRRSIQRTRV